MPLSCVTMMMVWPLAFSSFSIFSTISPLALSRAPVGSSHSSISPPFIKALAILTRCCCPPLSLFGFWYSLPLSPSISKSSKARAVLSSLCEPA